MNRELAKYIRGLTDEVSIDIWLKVIGESARNGTANIKYDDLIKHYKFDSKAELKKYFNPKLAEQKGVIKILVAADTFISINFYEKSKQEIGPTQVKLLKAETDPEPTLLPAVIKPTPAISQKTVQNIIGHYVIFFKQFQVHQAIIAGIELQSPVPPKIGSEDVRHIKELAAYFKLSPKVNTDDEVIACFQAVFNNWFNLKPYLQKKIKLRYMTEAIDEIIISIRNANNGKREKNKKESELDDKIKRAGEKDYSKLASLREKSN